MITKVVFTVGAVLRGDDAAGPMLAKMLEQSPIPGWTCIDGGQTPEDDLAVIRRMQPDVLLLVDASQMGREPGTIGVVDERDVVSDLLITTTPCPSPSCWKTSRRAASRSSFSAFSPRGWSSWSPSRPRCSEASRRFTSSSSKGLISRICLCRAGDCAVGPARGKERLR